MLLLHAGRFRLLEALDLPLGWPDGLAATRIATALARKYDPEETRVAKLLLVHAHGPGILATREPVRTLDDLRNRRIRGTGLSAQIIAKLGATPVGMPQSDTYDALQKGVAEGTFCPVETLKGWRQAETIRFVTDSSEPIGYTTAMFVAMNLNTWNKLPPDIQQIFLDVTDEFIDEHGRAWNQADQDGWELVRSLGREVIPLSDAEKTRWKQAAAPILEDYVRAAEAEGLPGRAFLEDAQRMIAEARSDADPTPDAD
ncbi:MAG: TRAP transporter substrate-binding protein DctP [Kiritimatiellae bacterium]|nr:TRAP transporter substrate-binding protein DctP [Kiritimatiellia bacterium]